MYRLPGMYYNGTVKITHQVTSSSVWDMPAQAGLGPNSCDNKDGTPKTYEYPALLMVGPTGNASDSNPIFWALRAFQPPDQQLASEQYLNVDQRWIHIRSSDFVVTDQSLATQYFGQYDYLASDETNQHQVTRTYWDTNITSLDGSSFNADATYTAAPPNISPLSSYNGERSYPKTSQYITLSDICYEGYDFFLSYAAVPKSKIPKDNLYDYTTLVTSFLSSGATARLEDIGADTARFTLNGSSAPNDLAFVPEDPDKGCTYQTTFVTRFVNGLSLMQDEASAGTSERFWNLSVTVGLSFEGSLVRENSTSVNGTRDGKPTFARGYEREDAATTSQNSTSAKSMADCLHGTSVWQVAAALFVALSVSSLVLY